MTNHEGIEVTDNKIAAWWTMFGPPPVLSSENRDGYDNLRNAYVAYYRPTDARRWAWIRELVDTQWEILRHLRYRTAALEWSHAKWIHGRRKVVQQHLQKPKEEIRELLHYCGDNEIALNRVASIKRHVANFEATLEKLAKPDDQKHSLALQREAKYVEKIDKWLKNAIERRNKLLAIIEYFRRRDDQEGDIPAVGDSAMPYDQVKQIAAPSVTPIFVGDITTEHHPEAVACASAATDSTNQGK
jgi:hypothetical protein